MLTVSDIASLYEISCQQVCDLIDYGYLSVAQLDRNSNKGIKYLFSEQDVHALDIHSHLAEINDLHRTNTQLNRNSSDFKKVLKTINYYDRFLEQIEYYPEKEALKVAFFLFHLNHYAKSYSNRSDELYSLKQRVLEKLYTKNPELIEVIYLLGPDRKKVWLCEDCKENARTVGLSYSVYIKKELYCPKCDVLSVEKEFYSLLEFRLSVDNFRFTFHLPLYSAKKWISNLDELPQTVRRTTKYDDKMYLYGRSIGRVEEKVFPLAMIISELNTYLEG